MGERRAWRLHGALKAEACLTLTSAARHCHGTQPPRDYSIRIAHLCINHNIAMFAQCP